MPELPEVETLRRELSRIITDRIIVSAEVLWPKTVLPLSPASFSRLIRNKKIEVIERNAKTLAFRLSGNFSLVFHLKMTGQLIYDAPHKKRLAGGHPDKSLAGPMPNKFTRVIFKLNDGGALYFNDMRKFGWARLLKPGEQIPLIEGLGIEPLSKDFTVQTLTEAFNRYPNRTVKQILMDQTLVAGLGNIYADESCFLAKVRPDRKVSTLKILDIENLHRAIVSVLKLSIQKKGTSSRNYARLDGKPGGFVPHLNVYGRAGQPCKVCGTPIEKIKHAGRGTHYCPRCQK